MPEDGMMIELKKVKYSKAFSKETSAFVAEVWVDGVKRGTAENDGGGGMNVLRPYSLQREIDAYAATLPRDPKFPNTTPSADFLIGDLVDQHVIGKELDRKLKTKTVFMRNGSMFETRGPAPADASKVLNLLPRVEALAIFMGRGA